MSKEAELMDGSSKVEGGALVPLKASYSLSPEIVMIADPRGVRAEAVRALRTHIMAQHVNDGRRGLAVCGASAGVGTTFVAVNLAVALAQIGVKVLLIDGDLRQSQVDNFIHASRPVSGLQQCLQSDDLNMSSTIQPDVVENLSVMFAGGTPSNAQELLASDRFADLIDRCLRDYDLTIIDTPPANLCADSRRISTVAGYSLIVAKRHESFVGDIKALSAQLIEDRAHVVGTVMNEA